MTSFRTDIALRQARDADSQSDLAIAEDNVCRAFYREPSELVAGVWSG